MKNFLEIIMTIVFLLVTLVAGYFFMNTQYKAAFQSLSVGTYFVQSISRFIWFIVCFSAFLYSSHSLSLEEEQ